MRRAKRVPLNVTLAPETCRELAKIAQGNRSAAIEWLLDQHLERQRATAEQLDPST